MLNEAQTEVRKGAPCRPRRRRWRVHAVALPGAVLAVLGALAATPAESALRCGARLVTEGDRKLDVLARCGEPALIEERLAYRTLRRPALTPLPGKHGSVVHDSVVIPIDLEEWTYNFGPRRLMRLVRFANGRVVEIVSLDYGY